MNLIRIKHIICISPIEIFIAKANQKLLNIFRAQRARRGYTSLPLMKSFPTILYPFNSMDYTIYK